MHREQTYNRLASSWVMFEDIVVKSKLELRGADVLRLKVLALHMIVPDSATYTRIIASRDYGELRGEGIMSRRRRKSELRSPEIS